MGEGNNQQGAVEIIQSHTHRETSRRDRTTSGAGRDDLAQTSGQAKGMFLIPSLLFWSSSLESVSFPASQLPSYTGSWVGGWGYIVCQAGNLELEIFIGTYKAAFIERDRVV